MTSSFGDRNANKSEMLVSGFETKEEDITYRVWNPRAKPALCRQASQLLASRLLRELNRMKDWMECQSDACTKESWGPSQQRMMVVYMLGSMHSRRGCRLDQEGRVVVSTGAAAHGCGLHADLDTFQARLSTKVERPRSRVDRSSAWPSRYTGLDAFQLGFD